MDLGLADKVAVVTGANKGIGFAVTKALLAEGARVVAGSRSTENLDDLDRVTAVPVDLMSADGPALLVRRAVDEHGRLDVLVNNVGAVRIRTEGFLGTSDEEFEWALQIDFFTGLRATRAALGPMLEQGSGSIVNVASVNSFFQPDAATIDYGVAKAAVVNLSKSLAQEFGPKGIRVNCVSPGQVSTDLWLGEDGVAAAIGKAIWCGRRLGPRGGRREHRNGTVHHTRGGRHVDHTACLRKDRERDRCQLRHRRGPDQDDLRRRCRRKRLALYREHAMRAASAI